MAWAALLDVRGIDAHDELAEQLAQPWAPVRAMWGTDSAAVAGQRAMMALAGGPAKPRDPAAPRPTRKEAAPT